MKSIKQILIERDGLSEEEADDMLAEAKIEANNYFAQVPGARNPEEILYEDFGLEPDYVFELI